MEIPFPCKPYEVWSQQAIERRAWTLQALHLVTPPLIAGTLLCAIQALFCSLPGGPSRPEKAARPARDAPGGPVEQQTASLKEELAAATRQGQETLGEVDRKRLDRQITRLTQDIERLEKGRDDVGPQNGGE